MKFSIIIPFKNPNPYLEECMAHFNEQSFKDFEIILLPDSKVKLDYPRSVVIPTGEVKPSKKRNIGIKKARGDFVVFIDDDAYPERDFLKNCLKYFKNKKVGAVGGPQLTPDSDNLLQHVSGEVLSSFASGTASIRYRVGKKTQIVNELPTCNLIVRKDLLEKVGYFDETLLTAEDSKLCFSLKDIGFDTLYAPDVIVYHHRRMSIKKHIKQMYIYGRDLAWLLKDNLRPSVMFNIYPLPALFVFGLVVGFFLSFVSPLLKQVYLSVLIIYAAFILIASLLKNIKTFPLIFIGLFLTHISYGIGFILGIFSRRPKTANITLRETSKNF